MDYTELPTGCLHLSENVNAMEQVNDVVDDSIEQGCQNRDLNRKIVRFYDSIFAKSFKSHTKSFFKKIACRIDKIG